MHTLTLTHAWVRSGGWAAVKWSVPEGSAAKGYRSFRVRQTKTNSDGWHNMFVCGFEVYGRMLEMQS